MSRQQIEIEFKSDPTQDIVNKQDICKFGCLVPVSSVTVNKIGGSGMDSSVSKSSYFQTETKDGTSCCWGVHYTYSLKSQQEHLFTPSTTGVPIKYYTYVEGYIKIGIAYEPYTAPPETIQYSETPTTTSHTTSDYPPANTTADPTQETQYITELVPVTTEEWIESQVVKGGINEKCVNTYTKNTLGQGEVKADSDIISAIIPDVETAQRIGFLATINSEKTQQCSISIAPNFEIELGDQVTAETTIADIESNQRIFEINIDCKPKIQDFTISWMGAEI